MQNAALRSVSKWFRSKPSGPSQVFYLAGFAGSGKTTLARELAQDAGSVRFAAYTGKAAHVLSRKGCPATTIHRLIYRNAGDPPTPEAVAKLREDLKAARAAFEACTTDGAREAARGTVDMFARMLERSEHDSKRKGPRFMLDLESDIRHADLVVVDECSMVDERVGRDLESFGVPILVLGDPAQLPPVAAAGYFTNREPDVLLDEVHRQAEDSPILHLATLVRRGSTRLPHGRIGEGCDVLPWRHPDLEARAMRAEQILVGRNKTRHASNHKIRRLRGLGIGGPPVEGDRLICLRNDHEVGVCNGSLWRTERAQLSGDDQTIDLTITPADEVGAAITCNAWLHHFEGREDELSPFVKRQAQEFAYGYAITVHKSQGSQWDDVLVFDESGSFRQDGWRWLYTAITRAAKSLTLVTG